MRIIKTSALVITLAANFMLASNVYPQDQQQDAGHQLISAIKEHDLAAVQATLTAGAALATVDEQGRTALMYAGDNAVLVAELIARGADVNAQDSYGWPVIRHVIESGN